MPMPPATPQPIAGFTVALAPAALLVLVALGGCAGPAERHVFQHDPSLTAMQSSYGLLYDLMVDVSRVDGILWVKRIPEPSKQLIMDIAAAAQQGKAQLEALAQPDSELTLDRTGLPEAEVAVRESIESRQQNLLLFTSDNVERDLLISQAQATQYAWRLCLVIQEYDDNEERSQAVQALGERFETLEQRVRDRLIPRAGPNTPDDPSEEAPEE